MSTREEIEAAVEWYKTHNKSVVHLDRPGEVHRLYAIADVYLDDRQQRERDQQPPTREMFERLGATFYHSDVPMRIGDIVWYRDMDCPILNTQHYVADIDTIAKLRAACLLLGIETEGML